MLTKLYVTKKDMSKAKDLFEELSQKTGNLKELKDELKALKEYIEY